MMLGVRVLGAFAVLAQAAAVYQDPFKGLRGSITTDPKLEAVNATELAHVKTEFTRGEGLAKKAFAAVHSNATLSGKVPGAVVFKDNSASASKGPTFQSYYGSVAGGRGIWKWTNSLVAYQRHFGVLSGHNVKMAEVGVQSGGSILMWQAVLGADCHVYGLDINKNCMQFQNGKTTITIGDQADPSMWHSFFAQTAPKLDILVDDGGHESHQMLVTLSEVFYRLQPGGFICIEDIHGQHYVESFFAPAAGYIGYMADLGQVASVHVYPFLMIVQKHGVADLPPSQLTFSSNQAIVSDFEPMWAEITKRPGGAVFLQNDGWGPFLTKQGLTNFFAHFGGLHDFNYYATPTGCEHTSAAICTTTVQNSPTQSLVTGVHIYHDKLVAEVAPSPPVIDAVRKGADWIAYSGDGLF